MTGNWITFTDNAGCRVAAPVSDVACIVESRVTEDGKIYTGIKLANACTVSWVDAPFEEVLVDIFHSDIGDIKSLSSKTQPNATKSPAELVRSAQEEQSTPEPNDASPGFGF